MTTAREDFPELATFQAFMDRVKALVLPPPKLTLSQWADEHFQLSATSSAQSGKWQCLPYQREIMDCITDPSIEQVTVMKSARIGWSLMISAAIGYHIAQEPCPILVVQPTIEDAKGFSIETITPMLRDVPVLAAIHVQDEEGPKVKGKQRETILSKTFPGGVITMIGAQSGSGFRRISRRLVAFDEADAYPPSAGEDGDPITLGIKRSDFYWNRKILVGSTPLTAGISRVEAHFEKGDRRRFHVPCPTCGHFDFLVFSPRKDLRGHRMVFKSEDPDSAHFVCSANGCKIEHSSKRDMVAKGKWIAEMPTKRHASFHIWAAYSYSPNASWGQLVREFLDATKGGRETLRVFLNTVLGEVWRESGDMPDWEKLMARRESWEVGTVPKGVAFLTAGVDVQRDRWVYVVRGWKENRESWVVDAGVLPGRPSNEADWAVVDMLLGRTYESEQGPMAIRAMAVDSADQTQDVYNWCHRHPKNRVMAIRGTASQRTLVGSPSAVDLKTNGKKLSKGYSYWPVGVSIAKTELYGWLGFARPPEGVPHPAGYCHFPDWIGEDFFLQLTAEQLVTSVGSNGLAKQEWKILPGRENHYLDTMVYSRAAAYVMGLDRMKLPVVPALPKPAPTPEAEQVIKAEVFKQLVNTPQPPAPVKPTTPKQPKTNWIMGNRKGSWL
jgi:phage terminase large subunit GpA-like protein